MSKELIGTLIALGFVLIIWGTSLHFLYKLFRGYGVNLQYIPVEKRGFFTGTFRFVFKKTIGFSGSRFLLIFLIGILLFIGVFQLSFFK